MSTKKTSKGKSIKSKANGKIQVSVLLDAETVARIDALSERLKNQLPGTNTSHRSWGAVAAILAGLNAYEGKPLGLALVPVTTRKRGKA